MTTEAATLTTNGELTKKGGVQTSTSARVLVVLFAVQVYMNVFTFLSYKVGHGMAITVVLVVIAVAWCFGLKAGICAGVLTMPLNYFMSVVAGLPWWELVFMHGAGVSGTAGCILMGAIVGGMRDLTVKINMEISERKQAEGKIRQQRDQLDKTHKNLKEQTNERIRTIDELREAKEHMENLIAISIDPIVIGDSEGRIVKPNKAYFEMMGYSEEEIIGEAIHSFLVLEEGTYESTTGEMVNIDEDFLKEQSGEATKLFEEGQTSNWVSYCKNKENKIIPTTQNIAFLYNEQKKRIATFAIIRDITEQRKVELELIRSKEDAEEANQSKSAFLANMSHEIRTPMNGVIGFTDMILDTGLDPEQEDYAQTIKKSGEVLVSLINDILDFSKIEAGKIDIEEIDFDIEVLAYDVCDLIRPRIGGRDVEILCRIGDNLPAQVKCDPHRFRQVLINLLGNAVKFTGRGEIELSLDVKEEQDGRVMIHTKVRDTGIGIAEDKLEHIFDLFQQADGSMTREYGGSGLGLSIGRKIANLMGGDVWAESELGKGSTFHFTAWLKESEGRQVKRFTPVSLSGRKALITDDNETNLEILAHIVESSGMHVASFTSSEEALKAVQDAFEENDPFDICILDIMMPGMSGFHLAEQIRQTVSDSMPLLAFPSLTEATAKRCEKAGFNGFLPKPISRIKLLKMMERLLGEATDREQQEGREAKIVTQHSMREDEKHATSILLAEDNPINQKLATKLLVKAGYRVDVASNGNEAVAMFTAEPEKYDIIFMDVQMPGLNGLDATKQIRDWECEMRNETNVELKSEIRNPKSKIERVPIIAITAEAMKGDREKCLAAGMNDYVPKPIKREVVFEMLKKWVIEKV